MNSLIGQGIYHAQDIAQLTGVSSQKVRRWIVAGGSLPALLSPRTALGGGPLFTFVELVEVLVAGQLREARVPLQHLRQVHVALSEWLDNPHPFAHARLYSSGQRVIWGVVGQKEGEHFIDVLKRQHLIPDVERPHLQALEYDPTTQLARRWNIAPGVVVDPEIAFGKPVLADIGYPTRVLADEYENNHHDAELVATWYRVGVEHVERAVAFERTLTETKMAA